jgi:polyisoprenoid-binding protein YceI
MILKYEALMKEHKKEQAESDSVSGSNYFKVNEFIAVDPLIDEYVTSLDFFDKQDYPKCKFVASSIEQFQTQKI